MNSDQLKNRLSLLSTIQESNWFKDLERNSLLLSKAPEEGKDPNPPPDPGTPLKPEEERSYYVADTKVMKPDTNKKKLLIGGS
tara:strand:+ start:63 stop:311 length:249 start_codon:yes stop_codon:yes gene_type:complete